MIRLVDWTGLIDKPCNRKHHAGEIPQVGGLSIYIAFSISISIFLETTAEINLFVIASALMVYVGVLDDKYDLSVRSRLFAQFLIASLIIFGLELGFDNLGDILGFGDVELGLLGVVFTYLAVMAAINAYNMIDGMDGLLGTIALNTILSMAILAYFHNNAFLSGFYLIFSFVLLPFILANLGVFPFKGQKVFMGDAGSMFIGFAVISTFLIFNYNESSEDLKYRPVVMLYVVGLPLIDMIAIMYRRIKKGKSAFQADRDHIHHIFLRGGFSEKNTLIIIAFFSVLLSVLGILLELSKVEEYKMLFIFLCVFFIYNMLISHAWKFSRLLKKFSKKF